MPLLSRIMPFISLGIAIVLLILGLFLMVHILIWGAIIGLILYLFALIKAKFFPNPHHSLQTRDDKPGRTFDHEE